MSESLNTSTGELAVIDQATVPVKSLEDQLAALAQGNGAGFYSSLKGDDWATRISVLGAMSDSAAIADNLNKKLEIVNIIVQSVVMEDEQTKQKVAQPRVILIDKAGKAFHAISGVLYRDVTNWLNLLGEPASWPAPLPVIISREGTGTSKFFTAKLTK